MRYQVNIPEGINGNFEIKVENFNEWVGTAEPLADYTVLYYTDEAGTKYPIMQDTTREFRECQNFVNAATGDVLIAGLGLGHVHLGLINNPSVTSVTVVEKNQEVIDLVWDNCVKDARFSIVNADIYTWTPPKNASFDVGWFDSWIGEDGGGFYYSPEYEQKMTEKYSAICNQMFFWRREDTPA